MPLKISHLRKNLSILDTEKKRSRENPEIVIRFHVFLPPSIRQFSPLLFFRFPNSRNSYGVSTYTYIYIKKELKKNICLFRFRYRSKYPIFHSETDERIKQSSVGSIKRDRSQFQELFPFSFRHGCAHLNRSKGGFDIRRSSMINI